MAYASNYSGASNDGNVMSIIYKGHILKLDELLVIDSLFCFSWCQQ